METIKLELSEDVSCTFLTANSSKEPESILPDRQEASFDHSTIETVLPYQLLVSKIDRGDNQPCVLSQTQIQSATRVSLPTKHAIALNTKVTKRRLLKPQCKTTQTKATQCCIKPNLAGKKDDNMKCRHNSEEPSANVANQCFCTHCVASLFSEETNTTKRKVYIVRNTSNQENSLEKDHPSDQNNTLSISLYVRMPNSLTQVFDNVQQKYPSLYSILPDRLEIFRRDLRDIPCTDEVPCKLIIYSSGKACLVTVLRTIKVTFDISCADELHDQLLKLSDLGRHVFCPGLADWCSDVAEQSELVEKLKWPCKRLQSKNCFEWFQASIFVLNRVAAKGIIRCENCCHLQKYLGTVNQNQKLTDANTRYPKSSMSLEKRKFVISDGKQLHTKFAKLSKVEVHREMTTVAATATQEFDVKKDALLDQMLETDTYPITTSATSNTSNDDDCGEYVVSEDSNDNGTETLSTSEDDPVIDTQALLKEMETVSESTLHFRRFMITNITSLKKDMRNISKMVEMLLSAKNSNDSTSIPAEKELPFNLPVRTREDLENLEKTIKESVKIRNDIYDTCTYNLWGFIYRRSCGPNNEENNC